VAQSCAGRLMKSSICPSDAHIFCMRVCFLVSFLSAFPDRVNLRDPIHKIRWRGLVCVLEKWGKEQREQQKRSGFLRMRFSYKYVYYLEQSQSVIAFISHRSPLCLFNSLLLSLSFSPPPLRSRCAFVLRTINYFILHKTPYKNNNHLFFLANDVCLKMYLIKTSKQRRKCLRLDIFLDPHVTVYDVDVKWVLMCFIMVSNTFKVLCFKMVNFFLFLLSLFL